MRRATFTDEAVTYGAVGGTEAVDLLYYPPKGYRPFERVVRLGSGDERFHSAVMSLMTWGVQRGSGIQVTETREGTGEQYSGVVFNDDGSPAELQQHRESETVFAEDGSPYIVNGMTAVLKVPVGPLNFSAPVRIVRVVDEQKRVGFAYGTLKGHPESGEEFFAVEQADDGSVWFVLRRFSRPATGLFRGLAPLLRWQQRRYTKRYLRALLPVRAA